MYEKRIYTPQEIMDMPWKKIRYNSMRGYYYPSILDNNYPYLEEGIVAARWILEASWDDIKNFKKPRYHINDNLDEIMKMDWKIK